jgi:thermosome
MATAQAIPALTQSGQPILLLKEGSTETSGKEAQKNNIAAAKVIAEIVRTSLGPRGMDKMLVSSFGDVTITNDGATILKEMDIEHPAAKMMVEVSKTTDNEVGDGTTSVVILTGELLSKAESLIDKDVHPTIIVDGYRKAEEKGLQLFDEIAIPVSPLDRDMLKKVAMISMRSKIVSDSSDYLSDITVDAVLQVAEESNGKYVVDLDDIKVEKKTGESMTDTSLIKGVVLDKEVVHAGMPKKIEDAKIALLDGSIEIEKTEFDAKINIETPDQMKIFMDEETRMIQAMVDTVESTGANVVICQKGIDDVAQHFLAKKKILGVRRVKKSDMEKLAKATGGKVVSNLDSLTASDLGKADLVEERKIGEDDWVFVEGCHNPKAITIVVRGGAERVVDEAERSIHDALSVVKDIVQRPKVVIGGGAAEAEVATHLRSWAQTLTGREQLAASEFADAIEVIPTVLAENAGLDPIDIKAELTSQHKNGVKWAGVNVFEGKVMDLTKLDVYEPLAVKEQVVKSATEAACMILRIDDVIASGKMAGSGAPPPGGPDESEFE